MMLKNIVARSVMVLFFAALVCGAAYGINALSPASAGRGGDFGPRDGGQRPPRGEGGPGGREGGPGGGFALGEALMSAVIMGVIVTPFAVSESGKRRRRAQRA